MWRWCSNGRHVTVYLDGNPNPDIDRDIAGSSITEPGRLSIGGCRDYGSAFEGKIDEVAIYDRALTVDEVIEHFRARRTALIEVKSQTDLLLVLSSSSVGQGLGDKRLDRHFHQLERNRDGTADMNLLFIVREHDVEARSDHLHGIAVASTNQRDGYTCQIDVEPR